MFQHFGSPRSSNIMLNGTNIDNSIEANAKKQLNISFDLEHKHHKELLFLNLVGVSGFFAEFFCFM